MAAAGRRRRAARAAGAFLALLVLLALAGAALLWGSRPALDGERLLPGLRAPAIAVRDALGVVTIEAGDRLDLARAAGFVHAQERFLSMDFHRRWAAGELAALLGAAALPQDRRVRVHRFRARAERLLAELAPGERALLDAYAAGVNRGLAALPAPAFPYPLLLARPRPWRPEDSLLVLYSMHLALQGGRWRYEEALGALAAEFGPAVADFLAPVDSALAAPLDGSPTPLAAPLPGPAEIDLRHVPLDPARLPEVRMPWERRAGSNAFAVGGARTAHGAALLANDMHLVLTVPNIWFRMQWRWREDGRDWDAGGVTLPGMPWLIAGSNGRVAWGFTNGNIDSQDLRPLAPGAGPKQVHDERLEVRFGADELLPVGTDGWGPLIGPDAAGRERALRWTAHRLDGSHINFRRIERAGGVGEALGLFQRSGIPGQNVLVAGRAGAIAWTIAGPLFRRGGRNGRLPAAGSAAPPALLPAAEYPAVRNPPGHRLWSANSRHVGGAAFALLGDGRYAYAARARRIRDRLRERETFAEADLLDVQLDRRADHLRPWLRRLERVLDHPRAGPPAARRELRARLAEWDGESSADGIAYRALRTFRKRCHERFLLVLQTRLGGRPDARMRELRWQLDGPLDRILAADARHFLPQGMRDWDEFLARALAQTLEELAAGGGRRERIGHLVSRALPFLGPWLDAPDDPLPGDLDVVRVERGNFGASQRMVVAPGREDRGLQHMPGGQSGHPLSPFYLAGHADWVAGRPTPFLPGPERHRLRLAPSEH